MKRRTFLTYSSLAAAGFTFFKLNAFTKGGLLLTDPVLEDQFELNEITIDELQKKMSAGVYTSEQITRLYLKRIEQIDKSGPAINAIIELNPDALNIAKERDVERKAGKSKGALHGIPVLIKDNIDTADQMMTTAGSLALLGHKAAKDAFIIKQLRNSGAVLLGKTNLSEWANFRSTRSSSGWSSRGGQTHNPYILDRSPCGSSSGSAVAVAANLCAVAIGTETDGSIACPASMNGIVGIKPTVGLLSRAGIIPISKTTDTAGPFGRTVKDATILLSALAGVDPDDAVTSESAGKSKKDYSTFLDAGALKGKRIGVEKTFLKQHEGIDPLLRKALDQMEAKGATIVETELMKKNSDLSKDELKVLEYEFKDGLNKYLASANMPVKSLQDIIDFNKKNELKTMPYFKQEIMDSSLVKGGLDAEDYKQSLEKMLQMRNGINDLFNENKLDAFCGPATGAPWCIDLVNGDFWTGYGSYGPAAIAGFPSITVPMGNLDGLPIGISFLGKAYDEAGLISIAYAYEQASKNRFAPKFRKTFE